MTEDHVSFEVGMLLKEKKFLEKCEHFYFYNKKGENTTPLQRSQSRGGENYNEWFDGEKVKYVSIPTQALACKWLREKHGIHIQSMLYHRDPNDYKAGIYYGKLDSYFLDEIYSTPEQAIEAALLYTLQNLIK